MWQASLTLFCKRLTITSSQDSDGIRVQIRGGRHTAAGLALVPILPSESLTLPSLLSHNILSLALWKAYEKFAGCEALFGRCRWLPVAAGG